MLESAVAGAAAQYAAAAHRRRGRLRRTSRCCPGCRLTRKMPAMALHPTCSSTRMGMNDSLRGVAEAVADTVTVPDTWGCCGFAGDRGMLHPELTASATRAQAAELATGSLRRVRVLQPHLRAGHDQGDRRRSTSTCSNWWTGRAGRRPEVQCRATSLTSSLARTPGR